MRGVFRSFSWVALLVSVVAVACSPHPPKGSALEAVAEQLAPAAPALLWSRVEVPREPGPGSVAGGRAAFLRYCQACHGEAGDGRGALAPLLRVRPADLTAGVFKLKSTAEEDPPLLADLFRTVSAGIPASGMPSFSHLDVATRWALVEFVKSLSPRTSDEPPGKALDLAAPVAVAGLNGHALYERAGCAECHGRQGRGDGLAASELDSPPTDFGAGPGGFKGGATAGDVFRTLLSGLPGSPMPSYAESGLSRAELWVLAEEVAAMAREGRGHRVNEWRAFLETLGLAAPTFQAGVSAASPKTPAADGCLRCHDGIEVINDKMQPALLAFAGGRSGGTCILCHEGSADAPTEADAHRGLIPNPGSLWAVGLGMGCGKCHAAAGSLTSFQGHPLPSPVGGRLMNVVSKVSDPTGATGLGHAYRVPRGLMAAEMGKATTTLLANGLIKPGVGFADVPVDDPDGPVPLVGSPAYKTWVDQALGQSFMKRFERAEAIPAYADGLKRFGNAGDAAVGEFFRKDCARCHLWDRGFPGAGGRYRSEGCSACHVLYPIDGDDEAGAGPHGGRGGTWGANHPISHRITAQIPSFQCAHCHWRGGGYYADLHYERGMDCQDCHTSIDVHGDGNLYPTMHLQVEVACEDCHGTVKSYPWELPVGYGTPVVLPGARGVAQVDGHAYLLSSRGNARTGWQRRGEAAVVVGLNGREHPIPLLKQLHQSNGWTSESGRVAMDAISVHTEKLECLACHVKKVVQCQGCHVKVDMQGSGIDWVSSAATRASPWERADHVLVPGHSEFLPSPKVLVEPALGRDLQGRVTGLVPGCILTMDVTGPDGKQTHVAGQGLTVAGSPRATLAPLIPHATTRAARSCESCHTSPTALGYGVAADRGAPPDEPPSHERGPTPIAQPGLHWTETESAHGAGEGGGAPSNFSALDVNRLITRDGVQVKSLADPGEGPLAPDQREKADREGACLACHKYASTPLWAHVKMRLGPAITPEAHDRALQVLLLDFANEIERGVKR